MCCNANWPWRHGAGCVFTGWAGFRSPITLHYLGMATIRNSVFSNMHLQAEIVDVSFAGMIDFQSVSLVNISLEHGLIVSTTLNDYQPASGHSQHGTVDSEEYFNYYAEDDANYDMPVSDTLTADESVFGEQLMVLSSVMTDCVYLLRHSLLRAELLPACPDPSRAGRIRNRTPVRSNSTSVTDDRDDNGIDLPFEYPYTNYTAKPAAAPWPDLAAQEYALQPGQSEYSDGAVPYGAIWCGTNALPAAMVFVSWHTATRAVGAAVLML